VSECSSPEIRGFLGSLPAMFMALGISATYLTGALVSWDVLSYMCAIMPAITFGLMYFMPESPVWLMSRGKVIEARASAKWLKNETEMVTHHAEGRVDPIDLAQKLYQIFSRRDFYFINFG
jgi:hypothetical protein